MVRQTRQGGTLCRGVTLAPGIHFALRGADEGAARSLSASGSSAKATMSRSSASLAIAAEMLEAQGWGRLPMGQA